MILLVGMVAGFFVSLTVTGTDPEEDGDDGDVAQSLLSFSPKIFFIALLPPIIFNSGYHLRRELFFRHFTPICLFACLGTLISALTIAMLLKLVVGWNLTGSFYPTLTELLTFGALISATDPVSTLAVFQTKRVDPQLFYLVFGESVLNDAVGLVLFNAFAKFVQKDNGVGKVAVGILEFLVDSVVEFVGSMLLGFLAGLLAAVLLKKVDMRRTTLLELSLFILIMYVPYLLAEIMKMSGIVTILFSGIAARRYMVPNLSPTTQQNADVFFRLAAHLAETSIFLELGLSVYALSREGSVQWRFILWALLACLIGRAINIFPIAYLFNRSLNNTSAELASDFDGTFFEMHDESNESGGGANGESARTFIPSIKRDLKIKNNTALMLWFSGLRGAVAYACVRHFPNTFGHQTEFIATTMVIVLVTVFVLGGTTETVLNLLRIDMHVDEEQFLKACSKEALLTGFFHNFEKSYVRSYVIRDFHSPNRSENGDLAERSSVSTLESAQYQEQVEVTESDHLEMVRQIRKDSLYDYGSH